MTDEVLERGARCVFAVHGPEGPIASPLAYWWDGASIWFATPSDSAKVRALRRNPWCAAWVSPHDVDGHPGEQGVALAGRARVFSVEDPLGLVLHAAPISAAMTALAARNVGNLVGYAQDVTAIPLRFMPQNRVVVRVTAERMRGIAMPEPGPGIAPPLPTQVPSDVRRALGGRRAAVLAASTASGGAEAMVMGPVVLGAGGAVVAPPTLRVPARARAAVVLDEDPGGRPTQVRGVALRGELVSGRLSSERVTWWDGFAVETADVGTAAGAVVLPD